MARPRTTPPRRMTRSQSRELEDTVVENVLPGLRVGRNAGLRKAGSTRLSSVHEESPAISRPSSVSRLGTSLVPESPGNFEGHSNISGTTVLPQDSSSEDEPIILVDELPDLQSAAKRLLGLFVSDASDPRSILDSVKRITNPTNTDSKRLKRAAKKLVGIMNRFSSQGFIDVAQVKKMIPSVRPPGAARPWSPLPILHKANCARLALDVLLASIGTQPPRQAVERLERHFPIPFLDSIANSQPKPAGASTAKKQTFDLALEIRTQYFFMELERRQSEKDFDPHSILKRVFYEELALEEDPSAANPGSLRGFKLKPIFEDESGRLPESYQEDVIDRISELEYDLFDQDDLPNIQGLKRASWSRFILRTARFIHSRNKEILSDLRQQPKIDEVQDLVTKKIERRRDPASHDTPDRQAEAVPETVNRSSRASLPREGPRPPREPSLRAPPGQDRQSSSAELLPWSPSPGRQRPEATSARSPAHDLHRRKSKGLQMGRALDAVQRREERHRQQNMSHLESRRLSAQEGSTLVAPEPPANPRDEIPQSPPPQTSAPRSPVFMHEYSPLFVMGEEPLDLDGPEAEAEAPASRAMRRNNQGNVGFTDSPPALHPQADSPRSIAEIYNDLKERQSRRRAWTDRQNDARPVSPISEGQSAVPPRAVAPLSSSRKRSLPDSDSDDGFEQGPPDVDLDKRRAQKPPQARPMDKRPRTDSGAGTQPRQSLAASSQVAPTPRDPGPSSQRPSAQPAQSSSTPVNTQLVEAQPMTNWRRHNTVPNPNLTRAHIECDNPREKWSTAQTERLIFLMACHATSWTKIGSQDSVCPDQDGGPLLQSYDQGQLKDRARTLKKKYIREGLEPLPRNFEKVTIRKGSGKDSG